jgi:hypothetical protein
MLSSIHSDSRNLTHSLGVKADSYGLDLVKNSRIRELVVIAAT